MVVMAHKEAAYEKEPGESTGLGSQASAPGSHLGLVPTLRLLGTGATL